MSFPGGPAVLFWGRGTKAAVVVVPLALGAGLGAAAPWLVDRLLDLPWVPWRGRLELVERVPEPWLQVGLLVAGIALGTAFVVSAFTDSLSLEVDTRGTTWRLKGSTKTYARDDVRAVFYDGKDLVLAALGGFDLARGRPEASKADVQKAFSERGWPWHDGRPAGSPPVDASAVDLRKAADRDDDGLPPRWSGPGS